VASKQPEVALGAGGGGRLEQVLKGDGGYCLFRFGPTSACVGLGDLYLAKSTNIIGVVIYTYPPGRADPAVRPDFGVMAVLVSVASRAEGRSGAHGYPP
jgi:hypothetical protein